MSDASSDVSENGRVFETHEMPEMDFQRDFEEADGGRPERERLIATLEAELGKANAEKEAYKTEAMFAESSELLLFREYTPILKARISQLEAENKALREQLRAATKAKESEGASDG